MTIPVWEKGLGLQQISKVRICQTSNWKKKNLRSFQNAYAHAPFLQNHLNLIEHVFSLQYDFLLDMNMEIINYILDFLRIETRIVLMSELGVSGKAQEDTVVTPLNYLVIPPGFEPGLPA